MNILIVGNGFDLSHYLPTKYDHFMTAMDAIENWDIKKGDMAFDDLFIKEYWLKNNETGEEWQNYFFQYTKAMYKTEEIQISVTQIEQLKNQLKENVWYQYFFDHVREVRTWIDFEIKIKEALEVICEYMTNVENYLKNKNLLSDIIYSFKNNNDGEYFLNQNAIRVLELLKIIEVDYQKSHYGLSGILEPISCTYEENWDFTEESNNKKFIQNMKGFDTYKYKEVTNFLKKYLTDFSKLFNDYLQIVENFTCEKNLKNPLENINKVYSFNYTSTYLKNYDSKATSYFLHGQLGDENKLVLGVSDLDGRLLHKFNLWGFTKYHQKLFFDTDYQFIEEFISEQVLICNGIELTKSYWLNKAASGQGSVKLINQKIEKVLEEESLNLNFYIWGHSLDESDSSYIKELFSFNEPYDQQIRIAVYYFNHEAKYDLLANLINILTKEKVEKWMKKGWLKFEVNPDIAKLNDIEPVTLPKFITT